MARVVGFAATAEKKQVDEAAKALAANLALQKTRPSAT